MRASIDQVEITTWNDYGESTHVASIKGDMPPEAKLFVTADREFSLQTPLISVPHEDVLSLNAFYATAWKTGKYPAITADKAWVMARPHPVWANPWGDSLGAPDHRDWVGHEFLPR